MGSPCRTNKNGDSWPAHGLPPPLAHVSKALSCPRKQGRTIFFLDRIGFSLLWCSFFFSPEPLVVSCEAKLEYSLQDFSTTKKPEQLAGRCWLCRILETYDVPLYMERNHNVLPQSL